MTAKTANIFSGSCTLNPAFARSRRIYFLCVAFALLIEALDALPLDLLPLDAASGIEFN